MNRKNMSFNQIVKRINYFFLVEFVCIILQEQGIWDIELCNNGSVCNIQKTISTVNSFL